MLGKQLLVWTYAGENGLSRKRGLKPFVVCGRVGARAWRWGLMTAVGAPGTGGVML